MSVDIVRSVKNSLVDQGFVLSGPDGAFEITKRVAAALDLGVLSKTTGNNSHGYAADIVMDHTGNIWDILIDAGGANEPAWQPGEPVDPARYRVSPYTLPVIDNRPPTPPAVPVQVTINDTRIDTVLQRLTEIQQALDVLVGHMAPSYAGSVFGIKVVLRPV